MSMAGWFNQGSPNGLLVQGDAVIAADDDGRLEVFVDATDHNYWHIWQTSINNGWSEWSSLGRPDPNPNYPITVPIVGLGGSGRLVLFSQTAYVAQISRNGAWEAWNGLKNVFVSQAPVQAVRARRGGRLEIFNFDYGQDNYYGSYFAVQNGLDPDSGWSDWANLGHPPNGSFIPGNTGYGAAVGANQDGRLEVFYLAETGFDARVDVWHDWETGNDPNSVLAWSGFVLLAASPVRFRSLAVANNQDRRLELFAIGDDGGLWHAWQELPNGGWSSWDKFPSPGVKLVGRPAVVLNGNDTLEAFAVDVNGGLWNVAQTSINNGWGGWLSLGGENLTYAAAGVNHDGRVEVFSSSGGTLWHRWETSVGGAWSS